jgi:hypothetical protein
MFGTVKYLRNENLAINKIYCPTGNKQQVPAVMRLGRGVNHSLTYSAEVKERVELYLYSPPVPSWQAIG